MKVSIIILNWNGKHFLRKCISSVIAATKPFKGSHEIILVDNGSTDGSAKFVKKHFPRVKVLALDKNYGFSEGNNKGVEKAKGDYTIFLNNDTEVDENWLVELVKVADKSRKIGVCGSKVIDQNLDAVVGEGYLNIFGIPDIRSKHDTEKECFFVSGASLLIKKTVLHKLKHCFDPRFFAYFEDVELCWRVKLLGYKVFYAPRSVVLHKGAATNIKKGSIVKFYHYRNKIWAFKKNLRSPLAQLLMIPVSIVNLSMILYWASRGQWGHGTRVLKYVFSKVEKTQNLNRISLKDQLKVFFI